MCPVLPSDLCIWRKPIRKLMAVSGRVRRPLLLAGSCHLKAPDLETLSGVISAVLTVSGNVVYVFLDSAPSVVGIR